MPPRRKARKPLAVISEEAPEEPESVVAAEPKNAVDAGVARIIADLDLQGTSSLQSTASFEFN